jgi:hypothetical protein
VIGPGPSLPGSVRLLAQRERGTEPPIARALERTAYAVGEWGGHERLSLAGDPPRTLPPGEAALAAHLEAVRAARARGEAAIVCLAEGSGPDGLYLFYDWSQVPGEPFELIWIPVTSARRATASLVAGVAEAFGAFSAFTEDAELVLLTRGARAAERARAAVPADLRHLVPEPPETDVPQLLVPEEFDRRLAPQGVFRLNYWSRPIVESVGEEVVRAASWAAVEERPEGALLLTAGADLANVSRLLGELDLRAVQERHRL